MLSPITTTSRLSGFARHLLALATCAALLRAEPVISEFMASNSSTVKDDDGAFSDWIEVHNPDSGPLNLDGWYLTDAADNTTKWKFPALTVPAEGYLVVWASGKNRRDPSRPLHANFSLSTSGEYLGLFKPDGTTVVSEYAPTFSAQTADISYGFAAGTTGGPGQTGYFRQPTPGAPNSALTLAETASFSADAGPFSTPFSLSLAGAGSGQHIRYVIVTAASAEAAATEPTAASPRYHGPIPISSTVVIRAAVFSSDDSRSGTTASRHYLKLAPDLAAFSSQLPILVLDSHGAGHLTKDGIDHPASIYTYAPSPGAATFDAAPEFGGATTMTVRGNFTSNFPKQSFNLTLQDERGAARPQALLGLDRAADWALVSPWSTDPTSIRSAYVYALSNRMGRWAPRTRFVEVFYHESGDDLAEADYAGISVVTDRLKIGKDRIAITPLDPGDVSPTAITGGYIVKLDFVPDATHYNFITRRGIPSAENTAVVIDSPNAEKLTPPQRDYIHGYIQRMEDALFHDQATGFATRTYLDYLDVPSWVDHHLLELFVGNVDALYRSDFFYKDRGGKLVSGPAWDFDSTMGSVDDRNAHWDTWSTAGGIDLWNYGWWGPLTHDPEFMQAWIDRWQSLRSREFSAANLTQLADSLSAEIGPAAASRDAARWPENSGRFPDGHAGEIAHLQDWITHRGEWIDRQFSLPPTVADTGGELVFTAPAGAQLAYTLDGSDPRSRGGAIAPNALVIAGPLVVPATANVHVRAFRADLKDVFPGTPWSSAIGGNRSSPLSPAARLINLSSRAQIGDGQSALIAGVIVLDTERKPILARAVGPTLAGFGAAGTLPDPVLSVFRDDGVELYRNSAWQSGPDGAQMAGLAKSVGAFPLLPASHDAALVAPLAGGAYTMQITSETGQTGLGLAELYALDANGRTANLSTRAIVRSGDGVLIGGFVVQGPAYQRLLIRAVGPSLAQFGVDDALVDPVMKIYSGSSVVVTVDDWATTGSSATTAAAGASVGAFALPVGSKDAALLLTVAPGAYTVEVSGKDGREGVALLEIYDVP